MRVRFVDLTPEAIAPRALTSATPVASFEVEGHGLATVLAGQVTLFRDVPFLFLAPRTREQFLLGLCSEVRHALWADPQARLLDLARRFLVVPDRDEPTWRILGFSSIQNVDLHLIKHVLGVGRAEPGGVERWSDLFGMTVNKGGLLEELEKLGCVAWKRLAEEPDPEVERPISLYKELSQMARARCIRLLAPLREHYMELACEVARATAPIRQARHIHLGTEQRAVMHFLDDRGFTVVAKGERMDLSVCTAFSALVGGETALGPLTLRRRLARVLGEAEAATGHTKVHSPLAWRVTR